MKIIMQQNRRYILNKVEDIKEKMKENKWEAVEIVAMLVVGLAVGYFAAHFIYYLFIR